MSKCDLFLFYQLHRTTYNVQFQKKKKNQAINPFPNKPWFLRVCSTSLLKTQWEKEKYLVTSNFSFFHSVFYPFGKLSAIFINFKIFVCKLFQFGRVLILLFGKGLKMLDNDSCWESKVIRNLMMG